MLYNPYCSVQVDAAVCARDEKIRFWPVDNTKLYFLLAWSRDLTFATTIWYKKYKMFSKAQMWHSYSKVNSYDSNFQSPFKHT